MPELLLELGCEELPASFVASAFADLVQAVKAGLEAAEIPFELDQAVHCTPRRLIVHFTQVDERQPDRTKELRGPSVSAAFDADGNPTPALAGFCRGQGVEPSDVRREGDYVWVKKTLPGRPTPDVLAELLPAAIRGLSFPKSMRWGASRMRFARPIRWILASFGGEVVNFEIEGVASGLQSRGHRFDHPEPFEARTFDELIDGLIARKVEPSPDERRKRIREGAVVIASGEPEIAPELLEENVFLTEWPTPIEGAFREDYLSLPEPVLVTAMAKHEKMFPVRGRDGKLVNRFVFVRNSGEDGPVRTGTEWVLNARFNDAKFFYDQDSKHTLAEFLERTEGIQFQEKLGTVRQRADRLSQLAGEIAKLMGAPAEEQDLARTAGLFAKADLSAGLVSELASLQGVVGSEYARRDGLSEEVCWAIATHYELGKNPRLDRPGPRTAVRVLMADQLDKLVGFFGIGLSPSGSSDPFGLRRAASLLIEAAWAWPEWIPSYREFFLPVAVRGYADQGVQLDADKVENGFQEVMETRFASLLEGRRPDLVTACLAWATAPRDARTRLLVLEALASDREFVQTATRPLNILAAARDKGQFRPGAAPPDWESSLDSEEGTQLLEAARAQTSLMADALMAGDAAAIVSGLRALQAPVNGFFEAAMIMADDPPVRAARLELVNVVAKALLFGGDFTQVVLEG